MKKITRSALGIAVAATLAVALGACSQAAPADEAAGSAAEGPAALVPESIASAGTITVATTAASPPEGSKQDDGSLAGYEIAIVEGIGEILGLDVEWQVADFASIIPGLQSARYDAATGQIGITAERTEVVDFVTLILVNQAFAASTESGLSDITIEDLCGQSIAVMQGSRQQEFGTEQSAACEADGQPAISLNVFQNSNDAWLAMQSGRADIYWNGATNVAYLVAHAENAEIVGYHLEPYPTGIALPEGSELGAAIAAAEQQMIEDGSYAAILEEWGIAEMAAEQAQLNPEVTW